MGLCNGAVMRRVLANWTYCVLFRRPFMCLLGDSFKQLPKVEDDARVYKMPRETREELTMLSIAAPFMFTHLSATHSDRLVCTDASTTHLGAVSAPVHEGLHRELWRLWNRKGWAGYLVGEAAEYVFARAPEREASGLAEELLNEWGAGCTKSSGVPVCQLVETWDSMEIRCGENAVMMTACARKGLRIGLRIDILLHATWDVRTNRVVEWTLFSYSQSADFSFACGRSLHHVFNC